MTNATQKKELLFEPNINKVVRRHGHWVGFWPSPFFLSATWTKGSGQTRVIVCYYSNRGICYDSACSGLGCLLRLLQLRSGNPSCRLHLWRSEIDAIASLEGQVRLLQSIWPLYKPRIYLKLAKSEVFEAFGLVFFADFASQLPSRPQYIWT